MLKGIGYYPAIANASLCGLVPMSRCMPRLTLAPKTVTFSYGSVTTSDPAQSLRANCISPSQAKRMCIPTVAQEMVIFPDDFPNAGWGGRT